MTVGKRDFVQSGGFDLADLFEPRIAADPAIPLTGFFDQDDGDDLANLFAPLAEGLRISGLTGFCANNANYADVDLADIFAAKNTRPSQILNATVPSTASAGCSTSNASCTASTTVQCIAGGGTAPYTYSWSVVSGTAVITAGGTTDTVTVQSSTSGAAQSVLRCTVTDAASDSIASNNCTVTFNYTYINDLAVSAPASKSAGCSTSNNACTASTTVTATATGGIAPYSYQWQIVSGSGSLTAGATSATVTAAQSTSGSVTTVVRCVVTDNTGFVVNSNNCSVTFNYTYINDLSASIPASTTAACSGSGSCTASVAITSTVTGGKPPYTYGWIITGNLFTMLNTASQTVTVQKSISGDQAGCIRSRVIDSVGFIVTSNDCTINFDHTYVSNLGISIPSTTTASCSTSGSSCGASVAITATVTGGVAPFTYSWVKVSGSGSIISGGTTATATVQATTSGSITGVYRCTVTDSLGFARTSNNCTVTFSYTQTGGGGGGGGCVEVDSYLEPGVIAALAKVGAEYDILVDGQAAKHPLEAFNGVSSQPAVLLTTEGGARLIVAADTPINLKTATRDLQEGHYLSAHAMLGHDVATVRDSQLKYRLRQVIGLLLPAKAAQAVTSPLRPKVQWETVIEVKQLGSLPVAYLSFGGESFAAGLDPYYRIFTHNELKF